MASLRFYLNPNQGTHYLMASISHEGKKIRKYLGYKIPNPDKQWKPNEVKYHDQKQDINAEISRIKNIFETYAGKAKRREIEFDLNEVVQLISSNPEVPQAPKSKKHYLSDIADQFYKIQKAVNETGTSKQYGTMVKDILAFEEKVKKKYLLSEIDEEFYREFGLYLISNGNRNNTVNKKITRIITTMRWAAKKRLISTNYFLDKFTFKGNDSSAHPPLNQTEIELMRNAACKTKTQTVCLDAFLFACETGLRISDVLLLHNRHIKEFTDNESTFKYIDFTDVKTTSENKVALNDRAISILQKYEKSGLVFKLPVEQVVNRILKDVAALDDTKLKRQIECVYNKGSETIREFKMLCEVISFHCGRSSYITNLLAGGLSVVYVQGNAGHSDIKTTMIYSTQDEVNRMKETLKVQNKK